MKTKTLLLLITLLPVMVNGQWYPSNGPYVGHVSFYCENSQGKIFIVTNPTNTYSELFYSTDNGSHWVKVNIGISNKIITSLDIQKNGDIYVGMENGTFFYSKDSGLTWNQGKVNDYSKINRILISNNELIIFTYTGVYKPTAEGNGWKRTTASLVTCSIVNKNDVIFISTQIGIFRSTDNGDTWVLANEGIKNNMIESLYTAEDGQIYAGGHIGTGFLVSNDNGNSWNLLSNNFRRINSIFSNSENSLFITDITGLYRSSDKGKSWIQLRSGEVRNLYCSKNYFIVNAPSGLFRLSNQGEIWEYLPVELHLETIFNICVAGNGLLFVNSLSAIYRSTNNGSSWTPFNEGLYVGSLYEPTISPKGYLFLISKYWRALYRTSLNKCEWEKIADFDAWLLQINSHGNLFAWGNKLLRSIDDGDIWEELQVPFKECSALIIDSKDYLYVFEPNNGLFRSTDNGKSWTFLGSPYPQIRAPILKFDKKGKLYFAEYYSYKIFSYNEHENVWILESQYPNYSGIRGLSVIENGVIFAHDGRKIYKSVENGKKWLDISDGWIVNQFISCLEVNHEGSLLISTYYGGIQRSYPSTTTISATNEICTNYSLSQNYPNPFNPETTISYSIPKSEHVTLKVYDLLGREVATLVDEYKNAGSYNSQFSIRNYQLTSGVYFYRLQSGRYSETKKFVLMK